MTTSTEQEAPARSFRRVFGDRGNAVVPRLVRRPLRQRLRLPLMLAGPILVLLVGAWWYLTSGRYVSTDDAYVQAARVQISNQVSGRVIEIAVHDNEHVNKDQALFRLDDRPFQIALEDAKAMLAGARLQVQALKATYNQKLADEKSAEEALTFQQREFDRQRQLLSSGFASRQAYDQAQNALMVARQKVASAQSDVANALAQLGGDPNIPVNQHPSVLRAKAARDKAELDLSYTTVRAPDEGIVTKVEQLQVGDWVQGVNTGAAPTALFSLVSTHRVWVEANFKETELTHMRPGQDATVEVDTYPDKVFKAKVQSLSPGTGLTFSLLPPENATGNWVKVVQRLPVRLAFDNNDPNLPLHAGLSVTVDVDTHYRQPWLAWLQRTSGRLFGTAEAREAEQH